MKPKNFLFVHGAWHAAAHWNGVVERLVKMGHRAFAIDLPGSGLNARYPQSYLRNDFTALASEPSPVAGIHLADYADAITTQLVSMGARARRHRGLEKSGGGLQGMRAVAARDPSRLLRWEPSGTASAGWRATR